MKIQEDKLMHGIAGFIFGLFICFMAKSCALALLAAVILGILKEIYDHFDHGTVEVLDAVATVLGGVVGVILIKAMM